jgi:acyl-CoA thioester hydrolase|tara:strand:+ start:193 stop:672 length:480 start_codon:yes stop_codon:yes gene_type:complete
MKNKFPYKGDTVTVTKDMCDMNGHMNVSFYSKVFDEGSFELYRDLGFSWDNETIRSEFSTFTLEENIRYIKENLLGEKLTPCYRIVNINKKLIHQAAVLLNEKEEVTAIQEFLLIHIDMQKRKSTPFSEESLQRIKTLKDSHDELGELDFDLRLKIKSL